MNYIDVKTKKGKVIEILESEFDDKLFTKIKEEKSTTQTKENKTVRNTKAAKPTPPAPRTITSNSFKNAED